MTDPFPAWVEALETRHTASLTFTEVRKALQALSSVYVQRRARLSEGDALGSAGKRAAFALIAGVGLHDKTAPDAPFLRALKLIERAAPDDRNFVKKGVSWALRVVGRRNRALNKAAIAVSKRLMSSSRPAAGWIGRDAFRELTGPIVRRK